MKICIAALLALVPMFGHCEDGYPSRPIRIVVPFTPGGATDTLTRFLGARMSKALGHPIIVDNKPGAGGSLGTLEVAKANANGYTLLMATSSTHGINPWLYTKLPYDPLKDFAPISMVAKTEYAIAVPANSAAKNIQDLVRLVSKRPVNYASSGNGTTSHLAAALLAKISGSDFTHIPYKSSGPALNDLLGGQVDFMFDNTSVMLPHTRSGKLRMLATTGKARAPVTPEVPTMIESGVPDYEMIGWFCILAPALTPQAIIERLNSEIAKTFSAPDAIEQQRAVGNEPFTASPGDSRAFIVGQLAKFKLIVEAAGAKLD